MGFLVSFSPLTSCWTRATAPGTGSFEAAFGAATFGAFLPGAAKGVVNNRSASPTLAEAHDQSNAHGAGPTGAVSGTLRFLRAVESAAPVYCLLHDGAVLQNIWFEVIYYCRQRRDPIELKTRAPNA